MVRCSDVVAATPPITDHTNGLLPWADTHGWKWSEIVTASTPACSAAWAYSTSWRGPKSSLDSV